MARLKLSRFCASGVPLRSVIKPRGAGISRTYVRAIFWVSKVGTIVSSNGVAAVDGAGVSDCPGRPGAAANTHRKMVACRKFTQATVLVTPQSTSGKVGTPRRGVRLGQAETDQRT